MEEFIKTIEAMNILNKIQQELKAPKSQRNSFGNYNYRSCEDILEAVKPLLGETTLTINDEMVMLGDRFYVKATVALYDKDNQMVAQSVAYARESLEKKGMDASQITGATSSYARKYALNGLFLIDDTKDADTKDNTEEKPKEIPKDEAKKNAEKAIMSSNNLDVLMEVEQKISKSKVLTAEDKKELSFLANERREQFDPTV